VKLKNAHVVRVYNCTTNKVTYWNTEYWRLYNFSKQQKIKPNFKTKTI